MSFVTTDIEKAFFDRKEIERIVDRETKTALSKAGASVRGEQRESIPFTKSRSKPGDPPSAHKRGKYSPKYVLFGYDMATDSVAVGMVKMPRSSVQGNLPLPGLLEKGGTYVQKKGTMIYQRGGRNKKGQFTKGSLQPLQKSRRVTIRPRPSAVPALEHEIAAGNVIAPWEGIVKP